MKPIITLRSVVKRLLDVLGSLIGLVLFSPVMLIVAIAVYVSMGRSVIFKQERAGLHGKPFML